MPRATPVTTASPVNGKFTPHLTGGVSVSRFREENNVASRVLAVLDKLPKSGPLYTVDEIQEATGFRRGFPQLRVTIDAHREYYGRGVADGLIWYGHPDLIAELKREKSMS